MTKKELIDKIGTLLDLADAVPDGAEIIDARIHAPNEDRDGRSVEIYLYRGIEGVPGRTGRQITTETDTYPDYLKLKVLGPDTLIMQLERKDRP